MTDAKRQSAAPARIFATVNGLSTRLPDGGRQLIGGWSQDPHRPRVVEYVRADLMAEVLPLVKRLSGHLRCEISCVDKYDPDIDDALRAADGFLKMHGGA